MNDVKLRLSLSVPGAQMLSREEALEHPKDSYDVSKIQVSDTKLIETEIGKGKKKKVIMKPIKSKEVITIMTRKSRLVKQNINITKEAFYSMIDGTCPPTPEYAKLTGKKKKFSVWWNMTLKERLEVHLSLIAESLGAVSYTYEIFDD